MKISTTWLKELLRRTMLDTEVVTALERAGIEVEQYSSPNPIDKNVVVALVKKVVQHPGADRLKIVSAWDGREELTIVCGAPNVREGLKTPLARVGAKLPDGTVIAQAKLRGETSNGMLCSERELALGDSHEGLLELPDSIEPGTLLCDVYPADGFVDIKTPANRFDLLGATGLAREVAAMADNELVLPPTVELAGQPDKNLVGKLGEGCRRFVVAELELGAPALSPDWLVARLAVSGIRSIGLIVDITNYVMLETAQPLHAYDAAQITLPFGVRAAKTGETLATLDGEQRKLRAGDLLVTDGADIIGLAGVRGGAATEITAKTKRIYLEAATFDGPPIRGAAKRHNLRTDASARFERGLSPEAALAAAQRAIYLLVELAGAKLVRWADAQPAVAKPMQLTLSAEHATRILGVPVSADDMVAALAKLSIMASAKAEVVTAEVPWWRPDLKESEDLIEELVRVIGYDGIPSTLPAWQPHKVTFDRTRPALSMIRNLFSGAGLFEVMTYSFVSAEQLAATSLAPEAHLKLQNPLSVEQAYLRTTLLPSHLSVAARNRMYAKTLDFYELSSVFLPRKAGEQPDEPMQLGIMSVRPKDAYRRLKGLLDGLSHAFHVEFELVSLDGGTPWAAGRVAEIKLNDATIGRIGQLDPQLVERHKLSGEAAFLELSVEPLLAAASPVQAVPRSRFPETSRDVTVLVPHEVTWQAVSAALVRVPGLQASFMSDYTGDGVPDGHKSLSLHLQLSNPERTPTDAEAAELETKVRSILRRSFGAVDPA